VINVPGCPAHPDWITQIIVALATGRAGDIALDELHRPQTFFKTFTQTGCTRVQFFEYKQSTTSFGDGTRTGCLFYEFGCRGPMTHSPCNRILWNRQSSKTRAGMPCTGCTEPEYPFFDLAPGTVFKTQKVSGVIPQEVPEGTDHLTYMAHAAAARIAAPQWSKEDMFVV
jgi:uptake hydrogenase small subunit